MGGPVDKKSKGKRSLATDEARLWEQVTGDVKPIGDRAKRMAPPVKPKFDGRRIGGAGGGARSSSSVDMQSEFLNRTNPVSPPQMKRGNGGDEARGVASEVLNRRNLRRIGKGRISIDDRIDLHGMRLAEAHRALLGFLRRGQLEHFKTVLVITGKGRLKAESSDNWMDVREVGVLRREVPEWLRSDELTGVVNGFSKALPQHGGDGALYVRLKRLR